MNRLPAIGETVLVKWSDARHLTGRAATVLSYIELINRYTVRLHHDGAEISVSIVDLRETTELDAFLIEATEDWFRRVPG